MARYKCVNVHGKTVKEHRLIWEHAHGPIPPGYEIHHINGNGRDNRLENLQMLSHMEHKQLHAKLRREGRDVVDHNDPNVIQTRERQKTNYQKNRESVIEWQREYRATHKAEISAQKRRYLENNPEKLHKKNADYYAANREKCLEYHRIRNATHSAEFAAKARLNYAKRKGFPPEEIEKRRKEYESLKTTKTIRRLSKS